MSGTPTNWNAYTLDDIWAMLCRESRSGGEIATDAWRRTAELCEAQAEQLEIALRQLAERWPPSQPAALAFQTWARSLVTSMRVSAEVADNNRWVLTNVTGQLVSTVEHIARLKGQATHNLRLEEDMVQAPTNLLGISEYDGPRPPENWWSDLNQQARDIMARSEAIIISEASRIQSPVGSNPREISPPGVDVDDRQGVQLVGGEAYVSQTEPSTLPLPVASGSFSPIASISDDDPLLGGRQALNGGQRVVATNQPDDQILGAPSHQSTYIDTAAGPTLVPGVIGGRALSSTNGGRSSEGATSVLRHPPSAISAGRAGPTAGASPMVPPIAGVPPPGARSPIADGKVARRRGRLDNRWPVPQGGPAVIEPPLDPNDHDPGPGVIGLNR